eukprot:CAMPEP_0118677806 /NCGR_PEP_ID=MMETSP0800-20121206/2841_1 /TAXON_ID=210618 ORGANISM="Striatella unipunctata, Strain CCMP2910" /NCGR_SAMPLE_ID=MMETSP0800 /ASSEMBLY_ACC=CAM_ASM_000638 /LENGTH=425 /DNA_ID=CAMNT_0006573539 /DNA_START=320 /DNA_END=1597 /DNA_ORIENTATION=+
MEVAISKSKNDPALVPPEESSPETKQHQFQRLKARMALAYVVGSEGNFGQPKAAVSAVTGTAEDSAIIIASFEAHLFIELLANTLHQRGKDGRGGYSASTFAPSGVLYALRCLLTNYMNQSTFATKMGYALNILLLKSVAMLFSDNNPGVDAEAAEHACFSLYLLSNYGFKRPFLPKKYGPTEIVEDATWQESFELNGEAEKLKKSDEPEDTLGEKILSAYLQMDNVTPAGKHAAEQILLRWPHLIFGNAPMKNNIPETDFDLDADVLQRTKDVAVDRTRQGAKPRSDIFSRPILRSRAPKKGNQGAPWGNKAAVRVFPSALLAVDQLSYGSTKVLHMNAIDDIQVANNIANSANGEKTESYNYWWSWEDKANEISKHLQRSRSESSTPSLMNLIKAKTQKKKRNDEEPLSIFGFNCGAAYCIKE